MYTDFKGLRGSYASGCLAQIQEAFSAQITALHSAVASIVRICESIGLGPGREEMGHLWDIWGMYPQDKPADEAIYCFEWSG